MAATTPSTIFLNTRKPVRYIEYIASEAITPGHSVALTSAGQLKKNSTSGKPLDMVAVENQLTGGDIDTAYASGDTVLCVLPAKGDTFYGFIPAGANVAIGDRLLNDGSGNFSAVTAATGKHEAVMALQAVNNSSGSTAVRCKFRVE